MRRNPLILKIAVIALLIALVIPFPARADGIIIPEPPICDPFPCPQPIPMAQLEIRYHHVTVTIQDQVAVTHVDQVFYNPNDWQVEGTYLFPIPQDAAVSAFTLWVDGKPVEGQVLDANQARQAYEEIVRSLRDPALLEYAGRGAVQARIFPIPPQGERRVELEYTQALTADNGLVRYVYPLSTEKFSVQPLDEVSISVDLRSSIPLRAVYSPSHDIGVTRESDYHIKAGYEAVNVLPDSDFALYFSMGDSQAFHLLTYRDPSDPTDPDGFFLLLLAPQPNSTAQILPKDVILVLDRSGSMEGEKFQQAQEALRYILDHLNSEDRFNIITFSTGIETYASSMRHADEANEARAWVDRLSAGGSTDINRALLEAAALADPERPTYLIFLTDGLPTEGVVESQTILDNLAGAASGNLRLFAFGVGYDVDTFLLDSLAQEHHGSSSYVLPGERLDEVLSSFYTRISTPVLTDLSLDFGDQTVYDLYPQPLPDLFIGSQILAVGRYRKSGEAEVILSGAVNNLPQTFRFPGQSFDEDSRGVDQTLEALPRLWATRKIGFLLNQIRLKGPDQETIDQIVRLSIRYGIVTPYTSYLVTEETPLGSAEQDRIAGEQFEAMKEAPAPSVSGQGAVQRAAEEGALANADSVAAPAPEAADLVRIVGSHTFVRSDGAWVDTAFDPDRMKTTKIAFLSEDYFKLAEARPDLAAAFALGERVIAISDGIVYEVLPSQAEAQPVDIPPTLSPKPTQSSSLVPTSTASDVTPDKTPVPAVTPEDPRAPGMMPCSGGLFPAGLLAVGVYFLRRRLLHAA
jgi:Ca-activated chloride channel family protein